MPRSPRPYAAGAAALAALLLAGCGDDLADKPDLPDETPALWNPCDVLDAAFVERTFGTVAVEEDGEPAQPDCRFVPDEEGEPAVTANYLLFSGTLEEAWDTMDISAEAESSSPEVAGADDARIVVNADRKTLGVTGFVANGDLIQSVNVVDPAPYDEDAVVAGVRATLVLLSEHALESGVEETD
jgi:hypothetical protein